MARPIPLDEYAARRIALIKPSALGDVVHALPVLSALRRRFPEAHLTWVVNRAYEPLLRGHPDLDATLPFDRGGRGSLLDRALGFGRFLSALRRQRFDLVLDLQGLLRSGVMAAATGAPRRVGLSSAREGARWFYTDLIPTPDGIHAVDRYWLAARALGCPASTPHFRLPVQDAARRWALERLGECPRPWLAVAVGARWVTKRWPPEHFAALLRRARDQHGATVVFVGGREDRELAARTAAGLTGPLLDLTGRTTLPQLAAVLSLADGMLANDTGPLHLAVALGRPVVAPYTCTQARLTGPYARSGAVETEVGCRGSLLKRCSRMECMSELTPDRLWPALNEVLTAWERSSRVA